MAKVLITQKKSIIKTPSRTKKTIEALGLGKINKSVEVELSDSIKGMISKVEHLVEVKEL